MILSIALFIIVGLLVSIYIVPPEFLRNRLEDMLGLTKRLEEKHKKTLTKDPNNIEALVYLGALSIKDQNYEEAYDHYSHLLVALRATPELRSKLNSFEIYLNFGISAYHQNKKSEAMTSLQKARLNLNRSETFDLFYYLGLLYYEKKDYYEACSPLQQTYNKKKNDKENAMRLAISYVKTGNYEPAYPILQSLTDTKPGESNYYLGICLIHMKDCETAITQLSKAARSLFYLVPAQYEIAKIHLQEDAEDKALKACTKIIKACNAETEEETGTPKEAQKEAEAAPENALIESPEGYREPLRERYYKELCFAYLQGSKLLATQGNLKQACRLLEPLIAMEPEYPQAQKLQKRYQQSLDNPQLFKLLECRDTVREAVAKKLMSLMLTPSQDIQIISIKSLNLELTAKKDGHKYYLWISLQDAAVNIRQLFHAHVNSKQQGCSHCIMATLSSFERDVEIYVPNRNIRLIQGPELRKLIKTTADSEKLR